MLNFEYNISTRVLFGRGQIVNLGKEITRYGKRVLLVYGSGSIKRFGLYDEIIKTMEENSFVYKELSGVKPNPRIKSVRSGVQICRDHNIDLILAAGGGSVIDCAKAIAAGALYDGDPWDFFTRTAQVEKSLPVGSILTLSATGSEMNGNSVISNEETEEKLPVASEHLRPKFSILDPCYTFSVPPDQTAAGVADIFSHVCEQYFSPVKDTYIQDRLAEAIFKTCVEYGPLALKDPEHYIARANLMWASSLGLNGLLGYGKMGDWATHCMEHAVSAVYDITHGVGLAILTPHWMNYVLSDTTLERFVNYARNIWDVDCKDGMETAKQGIERTGEFFESLDIPSTLGEVGVDDKRLDDMAGKSMLRPEIGSLKKLKVEDVRKILQVAL
jgi:alcohol dehydrogenase YqhD (iron-dependent ADH family)